MKICAPAASAPRSPPSSPTRPSSTSTRRWRASPCPTSPARITRACWKRWCPPWRASAPRSSGWWGFKVIEVRVPDEQEGTKAVVRAWLKQVGEAVAENDPLVELETDKVTQEVPAPAAGVLAEIVLDTDDEAEPGALLARISSSPAEAGAQEAKPSAEVEDKAPVGAPGPRLSPGNGEEARLSPSVRRALLQH